MRTKNYLLMALLAISTFGIVACSNDENQLDTGEQNNPASLTIKLAGNKPNTRALESGNTTNDEATINNFTAFLFNAYGTLEGKVSLSGTDEGTIENLTAGTGKRVVVIANVPEGITIPASLNYQWFSNIDNIIDLSTQKATSGLTMSGEAPKDLAAGENSIEVTISRIAAKIKLGSVTIDPDPEHDKAFTLDHVHMISVRGEATWGLPTVNTTNTLLGGIATGGLTQKDFLTEEFSTNDYTGRYFYVFPNDNTNDNATLLTLEGTYDGQTKYYAIRINDKVIGPNDGRGQYIKRNTLHTLHVTLKKLGNGTTDPGLVPDPATLDVTVKVEPWSQIPDQNIEW